ncbi:hypothetical protein K474DRAFT_1664874 [Panus rudis PR-1116 ss-1]|nr:hypothetical protein K474DRAFT_1664874 [Panus rudis PR-1116 ss-1]
MPPEASPYDEPLDALAVAYHTDYRTHVEETRRHLLGIVENDELAPSFLSTTYWTTDEKNTFFHSLVVHSRFRPDLIAQDIGSKNVLDVCTYIDVLDEAAKAADITPRGRAARLEKRKRIPIAIEASEDWCEYEEEQANALIVAERALIANNLERVHEEEIKMTRASFRRPKGQGRTKNGVRDREGEKEIARQMKEWVSKRQKEWDREAWENALDIASLKEMERLVRTAEEIGYPDETVQDKVEDEEDIRSKRSHSEEVVMEHPLALVVQSEEYHDEISNSTVPDDGSRPTLTEAQTQNHASSSALDHSLIDPALLAISTSTEAPKDETMGTAGNDEVPMTPVTPTFGPHPDFQPIEPPFPQPSTPHNRPIENGAVTHDPLRHPLPDKSEDNSSSFIDPTLSPASRKRLRKRLYMRRKRAEQAGTDVIETAERLKPGRKPKKADRQSVRGEGAINERSSGTHRRATDQEVLSEVEQMGYDANKLRVEGLDLFRLGKLARLMQLYSQAHNASPNTASTISVSVIKELRALVADFIRETIALTVFSRRHEKMLKERTKVWRISGRPIIKRRNLAQTLAFMGAEKLDKSKRFKSLLNLYREKQQEQARSSDGSNREDRELNDLDPVDSDNGMAEPGDQENIEAHTDHDNSIGASLGEQGPEEAASQTPRSLRMHRILHPPFVRLPTSLDPPPPVDFYNYNHPNRAPSPEIFTPWRAYRSNIQPEADELLPEFTDNEEMLSDLEDEDDVDNADDVVGAEEENKLWVTHGSYPRREIALVQTRSRKRRRGADSDHDEGQDKEPPLRQRRRTGGFTLRSREPSPTGRVKSKVYISDSD